MFIILKRREPPCIQHPRRWLAQPMNQRFAEDVVWLEPGFPLKGIKAARFGAQHPQAVAKNSEQQVACLEAVEAIQGASSLSPKPFAWTFFCE